jgi:GT2 family glycosyltransferase
MTKLSVIIPSKNAANLGPCIEAVIKNERNYRIFVIDDGIDMKALSHHKIDGAVEKFIPGIKPFVFARNCNIGIKEAGDDDVVLLNDDAILKSPGGFSLLQREAENHPEYGCIGATTNVTGQPLQKPQRKGLREVHHIAFMCVLIPRRTIDKIGMLDERYCIDYGVEDRDYCKRITLAGMKIGVHDGCFVDHASLTSSFRGNPLIPGKSNQNRALYMKKFNLTVYC